MKTMGNGRRRVEGSWCVGWEGEEQRGGGKEKECSDVWNAAARAKIWVA